MLNQNHPLTLRMARSRGFASAYPLAENATTSTSIAIVVSDWLARCNGVAEAVGGGLTINLERDRSGVGDRHLLLPAT